jgi:hypothetical protein
LLLEREGTVEIIAEIEAEKEAEKEAEEDLDRPTLVLELAVSLPMT